VIYAVDFFYFSENWELSNLLATRPAVYCVQANYMTTATLSSVGKYRQIISCYCRRKLQQFRNSRKCDVVRVIVNTQFVGHSKHMASPL